MSRIKELLLQDRRADRIDSGPTMVDTRVRWETEGDEVWCRFGSFGLPLYIVSIEELKDSSNALRHAEKLSGLGWCTPLAVLGLWQFVSRLHDTVVRNSQSDGM
jgi:hypothetical protein